MTKGLGIRKDGRSKVETYFKMFHYVYDTAAYASLSCPARTVLFEIFRRHNGKNNGSIVLPARGCENLGVSASAVSRAIRELVDRGLVTIETRSAFTVKTRKAAEYALAWLPVGTRPVTGGFRSYVAEPKIKHSAAGGTDSAAGGTRKTGNRVHSAAGGTDWPEMARVQCRG
jgi:hypothetical protein